MSDIYVSVAFIVKLFLRKRNVCLSNQSFLRLQLQTLLSWCCCDFHRMDSPNSHNILNRQTSLRDNVISFARQRKKQLYVDFKTKTWLKLFQSCQKNGLEKFNIFFLLLPSTIETYFHELWARSGVRWKVVVFCAILRWSGTAGQNLDGFLQPPEEKRSPTLNFMICDNIFFAFPFALFAQNLITILMSQYFTERTKKHSQWPHNLHLFIIFLWR